MRKDLMLQTRSGTVCVEVETVAVPEGVLELWRPAAVDLANLAHELRSPLSSMLGFATLLTHPRHGEISAAKSEFARHLQRSVERLSLMVGNLALGSSLERVEVRFEPVDLPELLQATRELFEPQARHLELRVDCPPLRAWAEGGLLRQVLHNLTGNAVRNTAAGGVTLRASAAGERVRIEVADTGQGLPEPEHAIRPFSTQPGQRRGIGLGLYVAAGLIRAHCGELRLQSGPEGTVCSFELERVTD